MTLMQYLDKSVPEANQWVKDFMAELGIKEAGLARQLLRSTLCAVRDCLPSWVAKKLGGKLPLVMREYYFQGWHPESGGHRGRSLAEFYTNLRSCSHGLAPLGEERVVCAFCRVLGRRVSPQEAANITGVLPEGLRSLWRQARGG